MHNYIHGNGYPEARPRSTPCIDPIYFQKIVLLISRCPIMGFYAHDVAAYLGRYLAAGAS